MWSPRARAHRTSSAGCARDRPGLAHTPPREAAARRPQSLSGLPKSLLARACWNSLMATPADGTTRLSPGEPAHRLRAEIERLRDEATHKRTLAHRRT